MRTVGAGCPSVDAAAAARRVRWVILALPYRQIAPVVRRLAALGAVGPGSWVVHTNGSCGREVLSAAARAGACTAAAHPFLSFAHRRDAPPLAGALWGIDVEVRRRSELIRFVRALGGTACAVPPGARALYHAAGVFAASHVVVQAAAARSLLVRAGVPPRAAFHGITAMMAGVVRNLARVGLPQAVTGPASRGETDVLRRQIAALGAAGLDRDLVRLYRICARQAARLGRAKRERGRRGDGGTGRCREKEENGRRA